MLMVWILSIKAWAAPSCARLKRMNNIRTSVHVVEYDPKVVYRRIPRSQLIRKSGDKDTLGLTVAPLISSMDIQTAIIKACAYNHRKALKFAFGEEYDKLYPGSIYSPPSYNENFSSSER